MKRGFRKRWTWNSIASELCPDIEHPRKKVLRILRYYLGEDYDKFMEENASWLRYQPQKKGGKKLSPLKGISLVDRLKDRVKYLEGQLEEKEHRIIELQNELLMLSMYSVHLKEIPVKYKDVPEFTAWDIERDFRVSSFVSAIYIKELLEGGKIIPSRGRMSRRNKARRYN